MEKGKEIDARGLSCPQPVILIKKAMDSGEFPFSVLVDTVTSCQNVKRVAEKQGCKVEIKQTGDEFTMIIDNPKIIKTL